MPDDGRSNWREEALVNESFAECNAEDVIDVEDGYRDTADGRATIEDWTIPPKVSGPLVTTRVVKTSDFARFRVKAGDVRPLEGIAEEATEGEVAGH